MRGCLVGKRRQRAQQAVHLIERAGKRPVHILNQQRLGLLVCQMRLKVIVGREQFVLTLQFHTPIRQLAIELVEFRDLLGKESRPAQQRKSSIHHIGGRRHGKGVGTPVLLRTKLFAHIWRDWSRHRRGICHLQVARQNLEIERQGIEDAGDIVIRRDNATIEANLECYHAQHAIDQRKVEFPRPGHTQGIRSGKERTAQQHECHRARKALNSIRRGPSHQDKKGNDVKSRPRQKEKVTPAIRVVVAPGFACAVKVEYLPVPIVGEHKRDKQGGRNPQGRAVAAARAMLLHTREAHATQLKEQRDERHGHVVQVPKQRGVAWRE